MNKLVESILDCASSPGNWNEALEVFGAAFGAKSAAIQGSDSGHSKREILGVGQIFRGDAADIVDTFMRGEDKGDDGAYQLMAALEPNTLTSEPTLLGLKDRTNLPPSPFRDALSAYGLGHRSVAVLNPTGPQFDLLVLFFGSDAAERMALEHPDLPFSVTLLSRSIALKRVMDSLRMRYQAALTALDHLGLGVFLVNERGEVLLSNTEARRVAETSGAITVDRSNMLGSLNAEAEQTLLRSISDVVMTAKGEGQNSGKSFGMPSPGDARDVLISIAPLSDSAMELEAGLRCGFVLMIDPNKQRSLDAGGLALLGALTEAETNVAQGIVDGLRAKDIAEQRETSLHTVRGQIKSVASKLRCNSQADIIRLAAATRLPFTDDE